MKKSPLEIWNNVFGVLSAVSTITGVTFQNVTIQKDLLGNHPFSLAAIIVTVAEIFIGTTFFIFAASVTHHSLSTIWVDIRAHLRIAVLAVISMLFVILILLYVVFCGGYLGELLYFLLKFLV